MPRGYGVILLPGIVCWLLFTVSAHAEQLTGNADAGAQLYNGVCKGCHGVSIAPTLRGIVGRPVASEKNFAGYSEALKARQNLVWTVENLNAFLTDPAKFAPGTLMVQTIPDDQQRADLIAFLKELPPPRR